MCTWPRAGYTGNVHGPRVHLALVSLVALCGCAGAPERVTYHTLDSGAERRVMNYAVYTPPEWDG
jgi:hypothetical protein